MPASKAGDVVGVAASIAIQDLPDSLFAGLSAHLTNVSGGDARHDLDQIDMLADPDGAWYVGYWQGHPRLLAALYVDVPTATAKVILVATRGTLEADLSLLGKTGPDVGNPVLVVRLLHVAIFCARAAGITALTNDPYDKRLAQKYERMGFEHGERLPLDDVARLTRAFVYVEDVYERYGLDLTLPPLPL